MKQTEVKSWEPTELEKLRQLLEGRYHKGPSKYAWPMAGACAVAIMLGAAWGVLAVIFLGAAVQFYIGIGYRKEMSKLSPGFEWSVNFSYIMAVGFALAGIAGIPMSMFGGSDSYGWISWAYGGLTAFLAVLAVVRMFSYLVAMRRLSESIRPQSGSVWGAQIRRCVLTLILLAIAVTIGWIFAYYTSGIDEVPSNPPEGRSGIAVALYLIISAMILLIFGVMLSVASLLIANLVMRNGERNAAESLIALINAANGTPDSSNESEGETENSIDGSGGKIKI